MPSRGPQVPILVPETQSSDQNVRNSLDPFRRSRSDLIGEHQQCFAYLDKTGIPRIVDRAIQELFMQLQEDDAELEESKHAHCLKTVEINAGQSTITLRHIDPPPKSGQR